MPAGLQWTAEPGIVYQEKMDGRFETRKARGKVRALGETVLAGEYVRGEFYAFDLLILHGEDLRGAPLRERLAWLDEVFQCQPVDMTGGELHLLPSHLSGSHLLRAVLARGGEGVVRKRLDSPWGATMEACKRLETFYCLVTGFNAGQSARIARIVGESEEGRGENGGSERGEIPNLSPLTSTLSPCGAVALRAGKCDRVRVGSIIKVEGFGLTRAGQIREPRPCKDSTTSWLVKF